MAAPLSPIQKHVNRVITELRKAHGKSPVELAAYLNVTRSFVAHVEGSNKQNKSYTLDQVNSAAYYFEVTIHSILPEKPFEPEFSIGTNKEDDSSKPLK